MKPISSRMFGRACAAALVALSLLAATSGHAGDRDKADRKRREQQAIQQAVERGELIPLPKILRLAQARVAGEVLKVEIEQEKGAIGYEVKILTSSGRVREVKLNARNGRLIEIEDE